MKLLAPTVLLIALTAGRLATTPVDAAVVVLGNRTDREVHFNIFMPGMKDETYSIPAGDVLPVPVLDDVEIGFLCGGAVRRNRLRANSVYHFASREGNLELFRRFSPERPQPSPRKQPATVEPDELKRLRTVGFIPVAILVDDDEPAVRRAWEERLRRRIDQASDIFEHHCLLRFKVVSVATWDSDDSLVDFARLLRDFERKATPKRPALLAIGFTSQYQKPRGRTHMGGTRGPLHPYILIREWSQHIASSERLEVLIHEMGHVLGACHSPDSYSVMRPLVGDARSRARSFRIGFDSLNTLALYLFGEELRLRGVKRLTQFSPPSRRDLLSLYAFMHKEFPKDTSASRYITILKRTTPRRPVLYRPSAVEIAAARRVIRAIVDAARENRCRAENASSEDGRLVRLRGDQLTELYFRRAAAAAEKAPREVAAKAYLLALAIALDDSTMLRNNLVVGELCRRLESDQQRKERLEVLGSPTVHRRRDLAQHFAVSCGLSVLLGPRGAETAGIVKELGDSQRGSGFSFADLSADMAGVVFATKLRSEEISLSKLADGFAVADFIAEPGGLPEGLSLETFSKTYGSPTDPRFRRQKAAILERLMELPGYRSQ